MNFKHISHEFSIYGSYLILTWAGDANELRCFNYSSVDYTWSCANQLCYVSVSTDPFSSSECADSLQFDHQMNVLHQVTVVVRRAIPYRWFPRNGRCERCACVIPPSAAIVSRAVATIPRVVIHVRRREFQSVVRHRQIWINVSEYVMYSASNTTHTSACHILTLGLNIGGQLHWKTTATKISSVISLYRTALFR